MAVIITFIPQITLSVRRLHDIGKSGWWYVGLQIAPSLLPNFYFPVHCDIDFIYIPLLHGYGK